METKGFNWLKLAIQVLVIFVFVLILVWIFPMPGKNKNYSLDNYNENLEILRTTARNYYTVDRLPSKIGESKTMTLGEMVNKKIIRELTDENGKTCDVNKSYVKVTKNNNQEYELRIELTCGNNTDYIYDTIGCYDVCTGSDCKNDTTNNTTTTPSNTVNKPSTGNSTNNTTTNVKQTLFQYRYKKVDIQKTYDYTCPEGYTLKGTKCYKTINGGKIDATVVYKYGETLYQTPVAVKGADKKVQLSTITSSRTVDNSWSYGATASQAYTNWAYSNTINTTKSQSSNNTTKYELTGSKSQYVCPTVSNCPGIVITYTYRVYTRQLVTSYSCPNGGTLSGSTCYVSNKNTVTDYSCPSDATIREGSGSSLKCYKTVPGDTTYTCADKSYTYDSAKNVCYKAGEKQVQYTCNTGRLEGKYCILPNGEDIIDATKKNKCIVTIIYTWNSKTTLSGWEKTGETRTITL